MKSFKPFISRSARLINIYNRQLILIKKTVSTLHEDLQFDYYQEIEDLNQ